MKLMFQSVSLFLLLTFSGVLTVFAAEENPITNKFSVGFEYNGIHNKDLRPKDPESVESLKITNSDQFYSVFSYKFIQNQKLSAALYGKIGTANLTLRSLETVLKKTIILKYDSSLAWGQGATAQYDCDNGVSLSSKTEYREFDGDLGFASYDEEKGFSITGGDHVRVKEFQTSLLLSKKISYPPLNNQLVFRPYGGPLFHQTRIHTGDVGFATGSTAFLGNFAMGGTPRKQFGWIAGIDVLALSEALKLSLEYEFLSEDAIRASVHYSF